MFARAALGLISIVCLSACAAGPSALSVDEAIAQSEALDERDITVHGYLTVLWPMVLLCPEEGMVKPGLEVGTCLNVSGDDAQLEGLKSLDGHHVLATGQYIHVLCPPASRIEDICLVERSRALQDRHDEIFGTDVSENGATPFSSFDPRIVVSKIRRY